MFRFVIPGVGNFVVRAANKAEAIRAVQNEITRRGFPLDVTEISRALDAGTPISEAGAQAGDFIIESSSTVGQTPQGGPGDDRGDFGLQGAFNAGRGDISVGNAPGAATGVDPVLANPALEFGTFANALASRGLNPEGALGSTFRGLFPTFSNLGRVGSAVGTVPPIGSDPGATERFFTQNLGTGNLEQQFQNTLNSLAAQRDNPALAELFAGDPQENLGAFRDVRDLARNTAATRIGALGAQLLPSNERFRREFDRLRAAAPGEPEDFFTFARRTFGV